MKKTLQLLFICSFVALFSNGVAQAASPGDVVITEIMYNPLSSETTTQTQYIELQNTTASPIDIGGWTIDDEDGDGPNTIPGSVIIPANGAVVIVGSSAIDFQGAWGSPTNIHIVSLLDDAQMMINLSNSPSATSEIIELRDDMANLIDTVNYDDSGDWPSDAPEGFSIYFTGAIDANAATNNDNGTNWAKSADGVDLAVSSTVFGAWNGVEIGSPGKGFTPTAISMSSYNVQFGQSNVALLIMTFLFSVLTIAIFNKYRRMN